MRTRIRLIAQVPVTYEGRRYAVGERFDAGIDEALALRYRQQAIFAPGQHSARDNPSPPRAAAPPDEASRRRAYRRRDLVPEEP